MMFMPFFSEFLYKIICCGYSFELHRQVDAIQMGTHSICLYKEVAKQYTSCNPKSTELLDCALIGVCAVIRSNMVVLNPPRGGIRLTTVLCSLSPDSFSIIFSFLFKNIQSSTAYNDLISYVP